MVERTIRISQISNVIQAIEATATRLVLIDGLGGAGKSVLAEALAAELGAPWWRKALAPVAPAGSGVAASEVVGDLVGAGVVVGLAGVGVEAAVGELAHAGAAHHHRHRALRLGLLGVERPWRH